MLRILKLSKFYIPVLIASTGSSLAAIIAGMIPARRPIMALTLVPRITFEEDNIKVKSSTKIFAITVAIQTKSSPNRPPNKASMIDSNKN